MTTCSAKWCVRAAFRKSWRPLRENHCPVSEHSSRGCRNWAGQMAATCNRLPLEVSVEFDDDAEHRRLRGGSLCGQLLALGIRVLGVHVTTAYLPIEAEPDRLREVDGIGPVRAGRIIAAW